MHFIESRHPSFKEFNQYDEHPDDAILLVKLLKSSRQLSQRPLLLFPVALHKKLEGISLKPAERNPLPDKELKEFERTARIIQNYPWSLNKGADYLRQLCARSAADDWLPPPPILDVTPLDSALELPTSHHDWESFAPLPPRTVFVAAKAKGKSKATAVKAKGKVQPGPKAKAKGGGKAKAQPAMPPPPVPEGAAKGKAKGKAKAAPAMPVAPAVPVAYGCSKCRWAARGCAKCRGAPAGS